MNRPIEYTVLLNAPQTQTAEIRMRVGDIATSHLDVALPVWRPGKYAVINPAGTVHRVRAGTPSGQPLAVSKLDKTTWRVHTEGSDEIEISYTVYANSLPDRTRHIDDTHAFLSAATVFFYVVDGRNDPLSVHIEAPAAWTVACGLESLPGDPRTLLADNYDVLVDSPIEIGLHEVVRFEVQGIPHEIVLWGQCRLDAERLKTDFSKIVANQAGLFGEIPYERYVFLIHVSPGLGGGTEHLNSTIMQVPPRVFEEDENYRKLLALASHELFHVWNVKRLRPAALRTLDYGKENYTDLLWFCEGTTSYYDDLVVVRAGLNSPDNYIRNLGDGIHQMRSRPGTAVQSLAESSFDAWIKFNQSTPDDINSTVSFYENGALLSLLLDLELRSRTVNRVSLDTLMREMYRRFPASGPGFTTADIVAMAGQLSATAFDEFFNRYVRGTELYPFENAFEAVGLDLVFATGTPSIRAYLGLQVHEVAGAAVVRAVLSDGPAYMAGLSAGDEIVAVNGRRFSAADLIDRVEGGLRPGARVLVHVNRRTQLRTFEFELGAKPHGRWQLSRTSRPASEQKQAYQTWLNHPWPE